MILEFPILNDNVCTLPIYIKELGCLENQHYITRNEFYENTQLIICTGGEGKLFIGNKAYTINDKNVLFINQFTPHVYYPTSAPWKTYWLVLDGTYLDTLLKQLNYNNYEIFMLSNTNKIEEAFLDMLNIIRSSNPIKHIECSSMIFSLLTQLSYYKKINLPSNVKTNKEKNFEAILTYIEHNYSKDISLSDISEAINLSSCYISRLFKELCHSNLTTYLNKFRISKAKKILLKTPIIPIKDIAKQTGFNSNSYFSAIFKKTEGVTPAEFRNQRQLLI